MTILLCLLPTPVSLVVGKKNSTVEPSLNFNLVGPSFVVVMVL